MEIAVFVSIVMIVVILFDPTLAGFLLFIYNLQGGEGKKDVFTPMLQDDI